MNELKEKQIDGLLLKIPFSVYDPAEDSFLLAENSIIKSSDKVLEIGSGSGYVSLYLAKKTPSAEFFCTDINYIASKATLLNAKNNSIEVHVITSNLLLPIAHHPYFDVVLFNSPYLPVNNNTLESTAWAGGQNGLEIVKDFIQQLKFVLKENGRSYLIVSSLTNNQQLVSILGENGFLFKIIDKVKEGRETILLYELKFNIERFNKRN